MISIWIDLFQICQIWKGSIWRWMDSIWNDISKFVKSAVTHLSAQMTGARPSWCCKLLKRELAWTCIPCFMQYKGIYYVFSSISNILDKVFCWRDMQRILFMQRIVENCWVWHSQNIFVFVESINNVERWFHLRWKYEICHCGRKMLSVWILSCFELKRSLALDLGVFRSVHTDLMAGTNWDISFLYLYLYGAENIAVLFELSVRVNA